MCVRRCPSKRPFKHSGTFSHSQPAFQIASWHRQLSSIEGYDHQRHSTAVPLFERPPASVHCRQAQHAIIVDIMLWLRSKQLGTYSTSFLTRSILLLLWHAAYLVESDPSKSSLASPFCPLSVEGTCTPYGGLKDSTLHYPGPPTQSPSQSHSDSTECL